MDSKEIEGKFMEMCNTPSDINEHLTTLRSYYDRCDSVTEFGVRSCCSLFAALASKATKVTAYDIFDVWVPQVDKLTFICADDLQIEIEPTDFLFIDTIHHYDQLKAELSLHAGKVNKFIGFHDTEIYKDNGEYGKIGLMPAIKEFLEDNKNWSISHISYNNNGLMIIQKN